MSDTVYAVYVVIVEDTSRAFEKLMDTEVVDTYSGTNNLTYEEALEIVKVFDKENGR